MSSWKECKLGDIAFFQRGHDLPKTQMNDGLIPVAGSNGIIGFHDKSTTKAPGITIGRSGNIGTPKFYNQDFWAHNTVLYVKDFKGNDEKFVFYFLNTMDLSGFNSGSAVPTLNRNHIHEIDVKIPPLEEQKAIAEILSSLDDKIDLLHRQNQTLESLAQTLFRQWFTEETKEDWEVVTLGDLGKVITGKTPSTSNEDFWGEDVLFITPTDFKNYNKYAFSSDRKLSTMGKDKVKNCVLPKNSILVTCIGSDMGKVVITKNECVTNQQINSLVLSNDDLLNEYVFQYLKSIYPLLRAIALGGTTMPIINKTDFENIEILLPTDEVLEKFQSITVSSNQKIIENTKQIQTLENLRDTLLPKLLSGEVRVEI